MFDVKTDHQIAPFGSDLMRLFDGDGNVIVTATRSGNGWDVEATDAPGVGSRATRGEAITAMIDKALEVLPGSGYSTLVPHGLTETP